MVAFEIDDAKHLASLDFVDPRLTGRDDFAVHGFGWINVSLAVTSFVVVMVLFS